MRQDTATQQEERNPKADKRVRDIPAHNQGQRTLEIQVDSGRVICCPESTVPFDTGTRQKEGYCKDPYKSILSTPSTSRLFLLIK